MTALDWIIVVAVVLFAIYGYAHGFIVGALSLAGFALGAFVGTRVGPLLLPDGADSPYAPLFGLLGALLAGAVLAAGFEGLAVRLRGKVRLPALGAVDGAMGAVLSGAVALALAWLLGVIVLQTPASRDLRHFVQRSAILQQLNTVLPSAGVLNALARFDPFPTINGPGADVPPPRAAILRDADVRQAEGSVVRIIGTACGLGVEGSGWVAAPDVVVTNAHVVAGEDDTVVEVGGDAPGLPATPIWFDPHNDVAVLRVPGLNLKPLPLADQPHVGAPVGILGYPHNGPFRARPGRVGQTRRVLSEDAYGQGPTPRLMTSLRGIVQPGNSGGPLVDAKGRVETTVFAATTGSSRHGGFGVPNSIVRDALDQAHAPVDTGPCAR